MTTINVTAGPLFDKMQTEFEIKNDAALAKHLRSLPSTISKMRSGFKPVTADMVVRIHEYTGWKVAHIKALAGMQRFDVQ
jgi:plasmid maintenance system antidote protein VapI